MAKLYEIPKNKEERTSIEMERMAVYNELLESRTKHKVLQGVIEQCKPNETAADSKLRVMAVVNYRGWKILIPIGLMGLDLDKIEDYSPTQRESLYKRYIISMLGSTVKFIVHPSPDSIDSSLRFAVCSREAAMKVEQNVYYLRVNKASNKSKMERAFEDQTIVKGRVVSTNTSSCFVEVYGKQVQIPRAEMSWRYVANVGDIVHNGDIVDLKIQHLAVNHETGEIDLRVSMKAAQENAVKNNMKLYTEGSTVLGTVSGISNGFWIQVGDINTGIDVYCKRVNCGELPQIGDLVGVTLFSMNRETGMIFGSIENIARRAHSWGSVA